jgi:hypothetical protein
VLCIDITNTPAALIESEERGRRRLSRPLSRVAEARHGVRLRPTEPSRRRLEVGPQRVHSLRHGLRGWRRFSYASVTAHATEEET